jgi:hypothetical protein
MSAPQSSHAIQPAAAAAKPAPETFSWRAFTTLFVVAGFTVLALSGVALYTTPPGRIANWSGWTLLGVSKAQWQSLHTAFGLVFATAAGFHLFFNWKILLGYLRSRLRTGIRRRRELALAGAASVLLAGLSVGEVPPVSYVTVAREALAASWETSSTTPPLPHMELLRVEQVAQTLNLAPDVAVARLVARGHAAAAGETLEAIARREGRTPRDIYDALAQGAAVDTQKAAAFGAGGLGWRTLEDVAAGAGMTTTEAIARLRAAGIDATAQETLRDIAQRVGRRAPDIAGVLGVSSDH